MLHIDNTLQTVEVAANNMIRVIENNLDKPDKMLDFSRKILETNPILDGCSISFEPFYYKEKGEYFSAYSYNNGDSILTENEGADYYHLSTTKQVRWSVPFLSTFVLTGFLIPFPPPNPFPILTQLC